MLLTDLVSLELTCLHASIKTDLVSLELHQAKTDLVSLELTCLHASIKTCENCKKLEK